MDKRKVYKIIPVEFVDIVDGAYVLNSPDGERYNLTGGNFPTHRGSLIRLDNNTFLRLMNDITIEDSLEEIVILNDEEDFSDNKPNEDLNLLNIKCKEPALWPQESTRILVEMYKKLKPLVDKSEIKTMKHMFEKINYTLKEKGYNYELHQVESKWKGLVRAYRSRVQQGSKRKKHSLAHPFEKELSEILSTSSFVVKKNVDKEHLIAGSSEQRKNNLDSEGTSLNLNSEGINYNLFRLVKAIETETSKREKMEEIKMEQRERLIQVIEKGNELLSKLLQQR